MKQGKKKWIGRILLMMMITLLSMPCTASAAKLNTTSLSLLKGRSYKLKVKGTSKRVSWSSSKSSVASVGKNGKVTAKQKGKAVITASFGSKKLKCKVTVKQPVTSVKLNKSSFTIKQGKTKTLKVSVGPDNANKKKVYWSSSDTAVAVVDSYGTVRGVGGGMAVITAAATDGSGRSASCTVNVTPVAPLVISQTALTIRPGATTALTTANAIGRVYWGSSNPAVATVSMDGVVMGVANGTAVITAMTADGSQSATCQVTVAMATGPSANAVQLLNILQRYTEQLRACKAAGKYVGYSNSSKLTPYTWASMLSAMEMRGISYNNCALMVRMALRDMGLLGERQNFWGTDGGIHFNSGVRETLEQSCEIIEVHKTPGQLLAEGNLFPGDICTWHNMTHTNVYAGNGMWYDSGRSGDGAYIEKAALLTTFGLNETVLKEDIANDNDNPKLNKNIFIYNSFGPCASIQMDNWSVGYIIRLK